MCIHEVYEDRATKAFLRYLDEKVVDIKKQCYTREEFILRSQREMIIKFPEVYADIYWGKD